MLELRDLTFSVPSREGDEDDSRIVDQISLKLPRRHFAAIVGPSGCGKSTLLKLIAGVAEPDQGDLFWNGRNLQTEEDLAPSEIGYVPQFSIAYDRLTVEESVRYALKLRVRNPGDVSANVEGILAAVGLDDVADRLVEVLSGGQRRRLAMALELVSNPDVLLCDEVTSGIDPQAEKDMVRLLHEVSQDQGRLVLSVTHSLSHLDLYDSVIVLYRGVLAYHGPPSHLGHYFSVDSAEKIYPQLSRRSAIGWQTSWAKHGEPFQEAILEDADPVIKEGKPEESSKPEVSPETSEQSDSDLSDKEGSEEKPPSNKEDPGKEDVDSSPDEKAKDQPDHDPLREAFQPAGAVVQFFTLLARRWKILLRSPGQLWLQLGLIIGFPVLVVIFAMDGLPQVTNLSLDLADNPVEEIVAEAEFFAQAVQVGSLVSGLVMFQVILLTLMGANNGAREIASERLILEKEKLAGLRVGSYVMSRAVFLTFLVAAQSIWMAIFVNRICDFPGSLGAQITILLLVNGAMTSVCLAISSMMKSSEQASLVSIYFVGFQLPLSGAVLALPTWIASTSQPFIAAFWGWSGYLQTMREDRLYDVVAMISDTNIASFHLAIWVLAFHIILGLCLAVWGCSRSRWQN